MQSTEPAKDVPVPHVLVTIARFVPTRRVSEGRHREQDTLPPGIGIYTTSRLVVERVNVPSLI
jgi:hypothetical protein